MFELPMSNTMKLDVLKYIFEYVIFEGMKNVATMEKCNGSQRT